MISMTPYESPFGLQRYRRHRQLRDVMFPVSAYGAQTTPSPSPEIGPGHNPAPAPGGSGPYGNPAAGDDDPFTGGPSGRGWGAKHTQRRLMQLGASNAFASQPLLWDSIYDLQARANTDPTYDLAANYGRQFEDLGGFFDRAGNRLAANLSERGLGESSAMAQGLGALEAGRAGAQSQAAGGIRREAQMQQLSAKQQLQNLLSALQERGSSQGASISNAMIQQELARQQLEAMQGSFWGDLFSSIGGLAGLGAQLGWQPFARPK